LNVNLIQTLLWGGDADGVNEFLDSSANNSESNTVNKFSNRTIIDVGGNIGDSALFFADLGFNVVAFEPVPSFCEIAFKNLDLNPDLAKRIKFVNKGVSDKNENIKINFNFLGDAAASSFGSGDFEVEVETLTIGDVLNDFNIENPYLLKIDCEGCENSIIFNSDLSMFEKIIFEYHTFLTGVCHDKLVSKLEYQGFKVVKFEGNDDLGIIHLENVNV